MTMAEMKSGSGRLAGEALRAFVLAGRAVFTVVGRRTGKRLTFKVVKSKKGEVWFVSVLTGPCNETDFTFLGTIFDGRRYAHGRRSSIGEEALSGQVFGRMLWPRLASGVPLPEWLEVWHEGVCGRCGRSLTVPESLATGLGPECARKMGVEG